MKSFTISCALAILCAPTYFRGMSELTAKQARFCEEYLIDLNATQAAIRAGYAESGARTEGARLLADADIALRVQELQAERSKHTKIDAQWLLDRLAIEATADVRDLYDEHGAVRPIGEWPLIFRQGLIQGIEVDESYEEVDDPEFPDEGIKRRVAKGRVVKFKLDSRVKRLELIGRHIGVQAFREQIGLSAPDGGPIQVAHSARDRIADRLNRLSAPVPPVTDAKKDD